VSAAGAADADVRLYDRLFNIEDPDGVAARSGREFTEFLNPSSLEVRQGCKVEPMLASAPAGARFQFERLGYFAVDPDSIAGKRLFNRTVSLKDTWAKIAARG
jgi:glutaminyl-tRNA synthetase